MHITISPNQLVLMAKMPMPPSVNHANKAAVKERKNYSAKDYLAGKKPYYPAVYKDPKAAAYKEEALWMLRCPKPPLWRSWQEPLAVRALREKAEICLDLEMWEFFNGNESDVDNRVKPLQDLLAEHLEINDNRVANVSLHKFVRPKIDPYIIVKLRITEVADVQVEQDKLDDILAGLTKGKTYGSFKEIRAFASAPTAESRAARR